MAPAGLGRDTGDSIMLFEETAPAGTETTFCGTCLSAEKVLITT